ncbi:MAG: hypothetical protein LBQ52_00665 [Helicobacteraceae bacterium]|nr:hypothetical protein [Helicobacteraceae bacterium]
MIIVAIISDKLTYNAKVELYDTKEDKWSEANKPNQVKEVTYVRELREGEVTNVRKDDDNQTYVSKTSIQESFYVRADANLEDGTEAIAEVVIMDKDEKTLHSETAQTKVKGGRIKTAFNLKDILERENIALSSVFQIEGFVEWDKKPNKK